MKYRQHWIYSAIILGTLLLDAAMGLFIYHWKTGTGKIKTQRQVPQAPGEAPTPAPSMTMTDPAAPGWRSSGPVKISRKGVAMTDKWKRGDFKISINADIYGCLAVHPTLSPALDGMGSFQITHVESGLSFPDQYNLLPKDYEGCKKLVEILVEEISQLDTLFKDVSERKKLSPQEQELINLIYATGYKICRGNLIEKQKTAGANDNG